MYTKPPKFLCTFYGIYKLYECDSGPNNTNRQAAGYETQDVRGSLMLFDFNQSWNMWKNFTETIKTPMKTL